MGYYVKNRQLQSGSTGVVVPVGTPAERPTNPVAGLIRYNQDTSTLEYYNGTVFQSLTTGVVTYAIDTFTGDGVTTTFTMSQNVSDATQIIVFVGSLYQIPITNYTVNGGPDITFTGAPPLGVSIVVIHTNV
jgi:hypothetical protein